MLTQVFDTPTRVITIISSDNNGQIIPVLPRVSLFRHKLFATLELQVKITFAIVPYFSLDTNESLAFLHFSDIPRYSIY